MPYVVEEIDEILEDQLTWDYCITGWKNLQDDTGEEIVCNMQNKYALMSRNLQFINFVRQCQKKLRESVDRYEEDLLGN